MNRIQQRFADLKAEGRSALIPYLSAGDPDLETSIAIIKNAVAAGADLIEVGMPFSDPVADGPSIQAASNRALAGGQNTERTFEVVRAIREIDSEIPVVLMGYYNPVYSYGCEQFVEDAVDAGIDGFIICDLPPEMDHELRPFTEAADAALIRFVTPASDEGRIERVLDGASGFIYVISFAGVTGASKPDMSHVQHNIELVQAKSDLPVCVGFGVSTPEQAKAVGEIADGVIVGSALVNAIAGSLDDNGAATDTTATAASTRIEALAAAL
ncbi:MAG: tryptophan synthase subunit alpha [Pseudomonadota bacterium]